MSSLQFDGWYFYLSFLFTSTFIYSNLMPHNFEVGTWQLSYLVCGIKGFICIFLWQVIYTLKQFKWNLHITQSFCSKVLANKWHYIIFHWGPGIGMFFVNSNCIVHIIVVVISICYIDVLEAQLYLCAYTIPISNIPSVHWYDKRSWQHTHCCGHCTVQTPARWCTLFLGYWHFDIHIIQWCIKLRLA